MIQGLLLGLAGVGLVLAGLRGLNAAITDAVATRLRERLLPRIEKPGVAWFGGLGATLLLQASAVTVLVAMALVQRGVVGLESAVLLVLGATVGTALKTWLFVWPVTVLGPLLVGVSSVALLGTRRMGRRRVLRALFSLGVVYLGWEIAAMGLRPLLAEPEVVAWLGALDLSTLYGLGLVVTAGLVAAVLVQSSSVVVFAVVALISTGSLGLSAGVALVLGANVGTTLTPLLASLEYSAGTRVVALMHVMVKAVGVFLVTLFFHSFLVSAQALAAAVGANSPAGQLAMAHTLFNVGNALVWAPLAPFIARRLVGSAAERRTIPFLARSVRRMLSGLPEEAAAEIARERDTSLRQAKIYLDSLLDAMVMPGFEDRLKPPFDLRSRILGAQELIAEVAVNGSGPLEERIQQQLAELNTLEDLIDECIALTRRVEQESSRARLLRGVRLGPPLALYREGIDKAWRALVHGEAGAPVHGDFSKVERMAFRCLQEGGRLDEADWMEMAHQLTHLQRIWNRVLDLAAARGLT